MRAVTGLLPGPRTVSPPDWEARHYRVLLLRYERIGDLIMATGLMRVLAQSHPHITLDVVAAPAGASVLKHNRHVRHVYVFDRRSWKSTWTVARAIRRAHYDVVVNGRLNHPAVYTSTPLLLLASRARYRIGAGGGMADRVYNINIGHYERSVPYIEGSKALAVPFGVDVEHVDWQPEIMLSDDERAAADSVWYGAGDPQLHRLLVNLSASEPRRRWADEHFVTVLQAVRERYPKLPIVVMGLPAEWPRVQSVATAAGARAQPTPELRQALALVASCDRLFTPDTSISHAGSAFRKRAVVLLKRDHHPYAPYNTPAEIVFWDGETIAGLSVAPVLSAVERLLAI